MKHLLLCAVVLCLLFDCFTQSFKKEAQLKEQLLRFAASKISNLIAQIDLEGNLIHSVFFKLKKKIDLESFIVKSDKLKAIEIVKDFYLGLFEVLGDRRASIEYDMFMKMSFDNIEHYEIYQAHPIHVRYKEEFKEYLARAPISYDYIKW